jgi:heme-degrading monooxygenase HmoA
MPAPRWINFSRVEAFLGSLGAHGTGSEVTYDILWRFDVPAHRRAEFEAAYGPAGVWAKLFARADGFIEVRLLRGDEDRGVYLTFDRWMDKAAFEAFRRRFAAEYEALDGQLEGIASVETRIGAFDSVA